MSSVEHLRDFVNERLTAAAEEIFGVFHRTIVEYEEVIDRQRKLLDVVWKPDIQLHGTGEQPPHSPRPCPPAPPAPPAHSEPGSVGVLGSCSAGSS